MRTENAFEFEQVVFGDRRGILEREKHRDVSGNTLYGSRVVTKAQVGDERLSFENAGYERRHCHSRRLTLEVRRPQRQALRMRR